MKSKIIAILGILLSIVTVGLYRNKAKTAEKETQRANKARETVENASDAVIKGLANEQEKASEAVDTVKRDHFTK